MCAREVDSREQRQTDIQTVKERLIYITVLYDIFFSLFMFSFPFLQQFLKLEFSEENIMFWIACEQMGKMKDKSAVSFVMT